MTLFKKNLMKKNRYKNICSNMSDVEHLMGSVSESTPIYCYSFGKRTTLKECRSCSNFRKY